VKLKAESDSPARCHTTFISVRQKKEKKLTHVNLCYEDRGKSKTFANIYIVNPKFVRGVRDILLYDRPKTLCKQ